MKQKRRIYAAFGVLQTPITKERDGGKIYIPSKQRVYIKQIILGPKFKAAEDTLPYLEYRCRFLAEELGLKTIEIKMSDADFI